ncbi:MAG: response regulator [Proteobacteria bacterium]|nr:response regulator [Pseudomonadota bacterium]
MKILIIDDDQDSRMILRKNLEGAGHQVEEAIHGADALCKARASRPELIISDILMPVMDGYKLCFEVKHDKELNKIPFVFYTATYTDIEDERLAIGLGASRYILKPMETDDFLRIVADVVREAQHDQLPVPDEPMVDPVELFRMYDAGLARKLLDKVRELEKAKAKIEDSERSFQNLFNSMRDVIIMTDLEHRIVNVNQPAMRDVFGYELAEILDRQIALIYATTEGFEEMGQKILFKKESAEGVMLETLFKRKNGGTFLGRMAIMKLLDEQGEVRGNVGIIHDITEKKNAEEAIRQTRDNWQRTFDAIPDIVILQGKDYRILQVNEATCKILDTSPEKIINRYCYKVFRGVSEPCLDCPSEKAIHDVMPSTADLEYAGLKKFFLVTIAPIVDKNGKVTGVVHTAKDITDQKKIECQLRQSQKMEAVGTLAGGIAHDFNNILTPLLGYSELALTDIPAGAKQAQADILEVLKAGARARELVKQILTFSQQHEQERKPLRMQYILKEALKLLRASLPTTIEIKTAIDEKCGPVLSDPTQIHQVLMNLCTNAYHAMRDQGGVLMVTLKPVKINGENAEQFVGLQPGRYLRLEVSDTGCGMAPEISEKIFEPYFTTKKKGEGTGLGLSVVHGIVISYGGHISVYSEPGQGTTFIIYFPQYENSGTVIDIDRKVSEEPPHGTERLLVVDDEATIVDVENRILSGLGYQVTGVTSSREALQLFTRQPEAFDLVITDMTMPKMTGLGLARQLLAMRPDLPIILCTGFSETVNEQSAKAIGIREFIMKPIDRTGLAMVIRKALDENPAAVH